MTEKYHWVYIKDYPELITFFKEWHSIPRIGNGHLFSRIIQILQNKTGLNNRELAKELGVSKSLISQSRVYLKFASVRLKEYVKNESIGINTAYKLTRLERWEEYEYLPPRDYLLPNVPSWIEPIRDYAVKRYQKIWAEWKHKHDEENSRDSIREA